jgi:hypothetical protein
MKIRGTTRERRGRRERGKEKEKKTSPLPQRVHNVSPRVPC